MPNNEHVLLRRYDPATQKFGGAREIEGADPIDNSAINPTPTSGSKIVLRVRAFIKVRHGKVPKKSIRTTVAVC